MPVSTWVARAKALGVECTWHAVHRAERSSVAALLRAGTALHAIKESQAHGGFEVALREQRIEPRWARYAMRSAAIAAEIGVDHLDHISGEHMRTLTRLTPDDAAAALRTGTIDLSGTVAELREQIRQLQAEKAVLSRDPAPRRRQAPAASDEPSASLHSLTVERTRMQGAQEGEKALLAISSMKRLAERVLAAPDLGDTAEERAAELSAALRPLLLHSESVLAMAATVAAEIRELAGPWLPQGDWGAGDQPDPLTVEQALRLAAWRDVHVRQMDADADALAAEAPVKRKRGRPRKSTVAREAAASMRGARRQPKRADSR